MSQKRYERAAPHKERVSHPMVFRGCPENLALTKKPISSLGQCPALLPISVLERMAGFYVRVMRPNTRIPVPRAKCSGSICLINHETTDASRRESNVETLRSDESSDAGSTYIEMMTPADEQPSHHAALGRNGRPSASHQCGRAADLSI